MIQSKSLYIRNLRSRHATPLAVGLVFVLALIPIAAHGVTGVNSVEDAGTYLIVDLGEFSKELPVGGVPTGAVVTRVTCSFRIAETGELFVSFSASDYQVYLGSSISGPKADLIYDRSISDSSFFTLTRTSGAFNGQKANQIWYFTAVDTIRFGEGQIEHIRLDIF